MTNIDTQPASQQLTKQESSVDKYALIDTVQQLRESLSPIPYEQHHNRLEIETQQKALRLALKQEILDNPQYGQQLLETAQQQLREAQIEYDQAHSSVRDTLGYTVGVTLDTVSNLFNQTAGMDNLDDLRLVFQNERTNLEINSGTTAYETTDDRFKRTYDASQDLANRTAAATWIQTIIE